MEEMSLVYNINFCRICQIPNNLDLVNTSMITENGETFLDLLKYIFKDITWAEDTLVSLACRICIQRIQDTANFKSICLESNNRRRTLNFDNIRSEIEALLVDKEEKVKDFFDFDNSYINRLDFESIDKTEVKDNSPLSKAKATPKTGNKKKRKENVQPRTIKKNSKSEIKLHNKEGTKNVEDIEDSKKQIKKERGYICDFCHTSFSEIQKFDRHVYKHNGVRKYTCNVCDAKFITSADMSSHLRLWCNQSKSPCPLCPGNKRFSAELLTVHMKIEHMIEDVKGDQNDLSGLLLKDVRNRSRERVDDAKGDADDKSGGSGKKKLKGKVFKCHICQIAFTRSSHLDKHVYKHDGTRNHSCNDCDSKFITIADLRNHKRIVHVKKEDYKFLCMECGARFPLSSGLKMHVLRNHTDNRNYSCLICHSAFYEKRDLQNHLISHSNRRDFKCDLCQAEYKHKNALQVHKTKAHDIGNYQRKAPEKYKCPFCLKIISAKAKLPRHIRTHTGVKPFKCRLCDVRFTCKSYIKNHVKVKHEVNVEATDYSTYMYYEICEKGNRKEESGGIPVNSDEEDECISCDV